MEKIIILLMVVSLLLVGCFGGSDDSEIKNLISDFERIINHHDTETGREQLRNITYNNSRISTTLWRNEYDFNSVNISIGNDTATINLNYRVNYYFDLTETVSTKFTIMKFDGEWKINYNEFWDNRS